MSALLHRHACPPALVVLAALLGCAQGTLPVADDAAVAPKDLGVDDAASLMDLVSAPDLLSAPDLVTLPDLVSVPDLVSAPDLVTLLDLVTLPDLVTVDAIVDTGPTGPIACTPATAAVCGARPCVDGFCCDGACDGPCQGCAAPGREGRCTNHPAATDPESECAEQPASTCGTTGVCNGAGACARHPMGTPCDDRVACTTGDVCDGAGACRGAAPSMCAPGAGNQCCLGSCDPMTGCRTTPGLCADQCSATLLRTGRVCQGCGAANAAGTCGGGGEFACDAVTHSLCQSLSCGGQTFVCTNDGGVWQWRTAARCDDGNACTHTDVCTSGACRGATITCASDTCATRACNGSASCTVTPRPGVSCDDGNAMTNRDVCSSAGVCVGTVVCAVPTDACVDGTQNRDRCAGARIIGRRTAGGTAGFTVTGTTCSASNRFDDCSWDAGNDHAYRLWARAGETLSATLTRGSACIGGSWDATLKLYQGGDCSTVTCSGDRWCRDRVNSSAQTYTAPRDGWIVLVVDGSTAFDDDGAYTLRVTLTGCSNGTCECP